MSIGFIYQGGQGASDFPISGVTFSCCLSVGRVSDLLHCIKIPDLAIMLTLTFSKTRGFSQRKLNIWESLFYSKRDLIDMKVRSLSPKTLLITNNTKVNFLSGTFFLVLLGACSSLLISPPAVAQNATQITEHLPPPPPLSPRSRIITGNRITRGRSNNMSLPTNIEPPTSYIGREYTFSAPNESNSESSVNNISAYYVEVLGSSDRLLEQVRSIEPKAFFKGDIIQVGIFSEQDNAANLVRQLALQGLWARIVTK